jgi:hypothetical protein
MAIEMAWGWRRFQPESALTQWDQQRFGHGSSRLRRRGIVALARKLLMAWWRVIETGRLAGWCGSQSRRAYLTLPTVALRDWVGVGRSRGDRVLTVNRS